MISLSLILPILMGFSPVKGLKKYVLSNGLTVYLKKDDKIPVVSIQLWVKAGALDETESINGVSHFLEHMLFKGTKKYPLGEISRIIESYGGIINAGTSKEYTVYYTDISKTGFADGLDIIADVAQNATFPEDEFQRERLVILEEVKRADDKPEVTLYEKFNGQLFSVTPYKWRILGTTTSVSNLSREKIISYYRKQYVANNMILVIIGDINISDTYNIVRNKFSYLTPGEKNTRTNLIEPVKPSTVEKIKKFVQQDYILCGFLGPEIDSKDQYAGDVLSIILGSGMSSRLYRNLREKKQLVYSIGSGFHTQQGTGIFVISAVCEPNKTDSVIKEISTEIDDILHNGVSQIELDRAKEIINSHWYFEQETCNQQASIIGYWTLLDRLDFVKKYITNINKVTDDDLTNFVKKYYTGLTTAIVSPETK